MGDLDWKWPERPGDVVVKKRWFNIGSAASPYWLVDVGPVVNMVRRLNPEHRGEE